MSDFKAIKQSKLDMHKDQLETYKKTAERLGDRRNDIDRQWKASKRHLSDIADESIKREAEARLDRTHEETDNNLLEQFRREVEEPTEAIYKELDNDYKEIFEERDNEIRALNRIESEGISDSAKAEVRAVLEKSAREFDAMSQEANNVKAESFQAIANARLRVLGLK